MESERVAVVRASYACFNAKDISGVLDLCVPDVEFPDVVNHTVLRGRAAIEGSFLHQFSAIDHHVSVSEVVEMGDHVMVVAHHQVYLPDGGPLGPGMSAVHRYSFQGNLIARMEWTGLDEVPEEVRERLLASAPPEQGASRNTHLPDVDILVVDDDEAVRTTMTNLLEHAGYSVVAAEDGLAALGAARVTNFRVVLLDLKLPVLDGPGFLVQAGAVPPVIVVTGLEANEVRLPVEADVVSYLRKPVPPTELLRVVAKTLALDRE